MSKTPSIPTIIHGTPPGEFGHLLGMTVAEVRAELTYKLAIPINAVPHIKGKPVPESYVLQKGDCLEYIKAAGVEPIYEKSPEGFTPRLYRP